MWHSYNPPWTALVPQAHNPQERTRSGCHPENLKHPWNSGEIEGVDVCIFHYQHIHINRDIWKEVPCLDMHVGISARVPKIMFNRVLGLK